MSPVFSHLAFRGMGTALVGALTLLVVPHMGNAQTIRKVDAVGRDVARVVGVFPGKPERPARDQRLPARAPERERPGYGCPKITRSFINCSATGVGSSR